MEQSLTAYPVVHDVPALVAYLGRVFGATEQVRMIGSAGGYHVEVLIGDTLLMIGGGGPDVTWKGEARPMAFHIYSPAVDAAYQRALENGGESLQPQPIRSGANGQLTSKIRRETSGISQLSGERTISPKARPPSSLICSRSMPEPIIEFLTNAFGAVELGRAATPDGVILHTTVKIGNSSLELFDANGIYQPMPGMFYLYVANADSVYRRALDCGAESISPPADQPYGDRNGSVKDVAGNLWYIATHLK